MSIIFTPPAMRTLLVEDDPAVACFVEAYLGDEGHEVTVTASPEDALAAAQAQGPFDLLVTDLNLSSVRDGADVAGLLAGQQRQMAIVMISGRPFDARRRMQGMPIGVILPKPFTGSDLLDAIERAIEQVA